VARVGEAPIGEAPTAAAPIAAPRTPPGAHVIRLAVRVHREQAELVLADLLELAPSGVEETEVGEGVIEYAVYGAPGELPELPELRAVAGGALVDISTSELPDDWSERWKDFHRPVLIEVPANPLGTLPPLHIRPPWEPPSERPDAREIVIDPAQAFGTGAHATTRLCLELLLEVALHDERRGPLLDIGTGSGVLAIAAAHLGFRPVLGLDNEQESVRAARENALVNGVEIEVRRFDLRAEPLPWVGEAELSPPGGGVSRQGSAGAPSGWAGAGDRPQVVLANLLRPLLLDLARAMPAAPPHLLASGLLVHEVDEVVEAFTRRGLRECKRRRGGEWAAVWLTR
jgi:ribosomal protein L11 methyltransferase